MRSDGEDTAGTSMRNELVEGFAGIQVKPITKYSLPQPSFTTLNSDTYEVACVLITHATETRRLEM